VSPLLVLVARMSRTERAELLRRAIDADAASERAGLLYLCSSFAAVSDQASVAASATAARRVHAGPPAVPTGSAQWGARWVAYDLPLVTACGISPSLRLFNWLLRSLANPSPTAVAPRNSGGPRGGRRRSPNPKAGSYDTVFVGSLSPQTDADALRAAFGRRIGAVSNVAVVTDGDGASKCFGFVSFLSSKSAALAVRHGLGEHLDGQHVAVKPSNERQWRGRNASSAQDWGRGQDQRRAAAASAAVPLPRRFNMPLDASAGMAVLQAMHAVGVGPTRQTYHNVLELCAAAAKSMPAATASDSRSDANATVGGNDASEVSGLAVTSKVGATATDHNGHHGALAIADEVVESYMASESIAPDEETVALQLRVCASCTPPAISKAVALLEPAELERRGLLLTTKLLNGLLAAYSRAGDIATVFQVFNERFDTEAAAAAVDSEGEGVGHFSETGRPVPDVGTYNILISACAHAVRGPSSASDVCYIGDAGDSASAESAVISPSSSSSSLLQLAFDAHTRMLQQGITPDTITLTSLLHACGKHAPVDEHRVVLDPQLVAKANAEARQHTERVIALFETSVSDVTQKREKAALARVGLHSAAIVPNLPVFSALIGAIAPNQLPEQVPFVLSQAEAHNVALNSFTLLNLVRRLERVRVDPSQFTLATRPEVREAAQCTLHYAKRKGGGDITRQPKGKEVIKRLKRLSQQQKADKILTVR
jgi:hypothetical protein